MNQKRILIIGANHTGYGHRSIAEALCEQLADYPDVVIQVMDGFTLLGSTAVRASKLYGPITRRAQNLWGMTYNMFSRESSKSAEDLMTIIVYDRFMRKLNEFEPGLIVSVHPMFNRSLMNILEYHKMNVPFVTLQADIININRAWCDDRVTLIMCPTEEAYESSKNMHGMPEEKLEMCGFPTRARFCELAKVQQPPEFNGDRPIRCLLMSGGEGSGNIKKYAQQLLEHVNCELIIICGRNEKLKESMEEMLKPLYGSRLTIHGFLDNVQDEMIKCDLVIARGSPNTMMEAVVLGVPLMITGSLPGQEADNPALMISHNLAILCENPESAPQMVNALMVNRGKRLKEIHASQTEYRDFDSAKKIAKRLYELALTDDMLQSSQPRFPVTILGKRYTRRRSDL